MLIIRSLVLLLGAVLLRGSDCSISFNLSAVGNSATMDNRNRGCVNWGLTYSATGFTGLTVTFQSAPDSSGAAGTFVTYAGTLVSGSNPSTTITQTSSVYTGYFPWLRVNLSGLVGSGSVTGTLTGWKIQSPTSASAGATQVEGRAAAAAAMVGNPLPVAGLDGAALLRVLLTTTAGNLRNKPATSSVALADALSNTQDLYQGDDSGNTSPSQRTFPFVFGGSTWNRKLGCVSQAAITLTASGITEIIPLSGSTIIRICHISMGAASALDIKLVRGTGANCATGTADVTGLYRSVTSLSLDFGPDAPLLGAAAGAICVSQSAAVNTGGVVVFAQF
jgi:hypothetical protein